MIVKVGNVTLCAGVANGQHIVDHSGEAAKLVQDSRPIGSASAKPISRANIQTVREISVEKLHADLATAEAYLCTHAESVLGDTGAVTFQVEPAGTTYTLSDGLIESASPVQWIGCTTVWRYRIRGGVFTAP